MIGQGKMMQKRLYPGVLLLFALTGCLEGLPAHEHAEDVPDVRHPPDLHEVVPRVDVVDVLDVLPIQDVVELVDLREVVEPPDRVIEPTDIPPHIVDLHYDHHVQDIVPDVAPEVVVPDIFKPDDPCAGECLVHSIQCSDSKLGFWSCLPGESGCNEWLEPKKCPPGHVCACRGARWCFPKGPPCICLPDCDGKECGDDGCDGSCGNCDANSLCIEGECVCQPDCAGKECGDDGCGGQCGVCPGPQDACLAGQCVCQPACEGKECGHDGCNGRCGTCVGNNFCNPDQLCEWVLEICADEWCEIPAGEYFMGPEKDEICAGVDETWRSVVITRSFAILQHEVTQADWLEVLGNVGNPASHFDCGGECPVEQVSWLDAIYFCNSWSTLAGLEECYEVTEADDGSVTVAWPSGPDCLGYRLPTDAEWEYAYRAGRETAYHNGAISVCNGADTNLNKIAWYSSNSGNKPHFCGYKEANGWGLYDMSGNVSEWVWDWHLAPLPAGEFIDPVGPETGTERVVRNCAYSDYPKHCRGAYRQSAGKTMTKSTVGLRVVRTLPSAPPEEPAP